MQYQPWLIAAVFVVGISSSTTFASNFTTFDFPGALYTVPLHINEPGVIVGYYVLNNRTLHGFSLGKDGFSTIDFPGALHTTASGINNKRVIVGSYVDSSGQSHGFRLSDGVFTAIDFPGSASTHPSGISDPGVIVGTSAFAFSMSKGVFTPIDFPGAIPMDINNRGVIVGTYSDSGHGFVLDSGGGHQ